MFSLYMHDERFYIPPCIKSRESTLNGFVMVWAKSVSICHTANKVCMWLKL